MKPMDKQDKQDKIRQENRRKLPGFLLFVALGAAIGAFIAIFSNWPFPLQNCPDRPFWR